MTTTLLVRRYLGEYARRPLNLVLLAAVPAIFVALAASTIIDFASIVGSVTDPDILSGPTAGWAAAFLTGVSAFFLVLGSREADRRLAAAGIGPARIVTARLGAGLVLALLAAGGALAALAMRTDISDPLRAVGGTLMFAIIYLAIGAGVAAVSKSAVNGSLVVVVVWMLDVFLGPAMAGGGNVVTRTFPSHFVTLVMIDAESGHAGPVGDLGWALVWMLGAMAAAGWPFYTATSVAATAAGKGRRRALHRYRAGFKFGFREYRRNPAMWALLVVLPVFFISLSFRVTPDEPAPVRVVEGGRSILRVVSMIDMHGAIMVPITVAFLAGLAGIFVVQSSIEADGRLALAGFRTREVLWARIAVVAIAALLTTAVSLGVTAIDFNPAQWPVFAASNVAVAVTYGMVGVIAGSVFGRVGGLYLMFLIPFVDVGIAQNVMFSAVPPDWGRFLPSRGAVRVLVDGAFTPSFDEVGSLMLALGWIVVLAVAAGVIFNRLASLETV